MSLHGVLQGHQTMFLGGSTVRYLLYPTDVPAALCRHRTSGNISVRQKAVGLRLGNQIPRLHRPFPAGDPFEGEVEYIF